MIGKHKKYINLKQIKNKKIKLFSKILLKRKNIHGINTKIKTEKLF